MARNWSQRKVVEFCQEAEPQAILDVLTRLAQDPDDAALSTISHFLGARHADLQLKPFPSALASIALISTGAPGIEILRKSLITGSPRMRYSANTLDALWQVSRGREIDAFSKSGRVAPGSFGFRFGDDIAEEAARAVRDVFAEALVSPDAFRTVADFVHRQSVFLEHDSSRVTDLMGLFAEAAIPLSLSLLEEFEQLLGTQELEEKYQVFLRDHPVFLDPLAAQVVPKQRLGVELATDFALRSHDDQWRLVEIERPHDPLFGEAGDFRWRFTHAFGQVLDFQTWVDNNIAYAQTLMPGIVAPRGLLIMGMRRGLNAQNLLKFNRFRDNSQRIDVMTFDDLLDRARLLYASLRG